MKFTLAWLKDHLDTRTELSPLVEAMTRIGLEVESVEDPAQALRDFTIAGVIEARPHPNADRLRVCLVDTGAGDPVQVVCGAPNARTGMKSVFSPPGTYIPGKRITLGKGVIRGVQSNGMLCSKAELLLSDEHDGIIELPADAPIGTRFIDYAGLGDPTIDINLTPNRPDATSVHGIARDLAAAGLGILKDRPVRPVPGHFACPVSVDLTFGQDDRHLCPAFALRLVRGVRNGPSPDWMQKRLQAIGLRPINALVDITNYLTFDRGRPLHVFDAGKVRGNLQVRRARDGEEILALDGRTYRLGHDTVVICDEGGLQSIAGIMGGEQSGCDAQTTDVLIESALWDPANIAQSGRALNINSDARYRFERGVDPAFCVPGLELATHLVLELCQGTPSNVLVAGEPRQPDRTIDFPFSEVARLTGLSLPVAETQTILERLGFQLQAKGAARTNVLVPSWRPDIEGKADIVEEVVRIAGLDRVAATPLPRLDAIVAKPVLSLLQRRTRTAKRALAARGLVEALTWSFIGQPAAALFGGGNPRLALANPIAADLSDMRPSLLPGLLAAAQRNADRGIGDVALFEVGQIFLGDGESDQRIAAAAVRRLSAKTYGSGRHWSGRLIHVDAFDAKADAFGLLSALGVPLAGLQVVAGGPAWFHPGRSGTFQFGPKSRLGSFGEFHPEVLDVLGIAGPLCGFELVLDLLPEPKAKPTKSKPKLELPELMPLERDFAFVVDHSVSAADLLRAVQAADRQLIVSASIFDVYEGQGIPNGKKSLAVSVVLQPREKTMTDAEIEALMGRVIAEVGRRTGATLRA
jgi:phenylalanyl-tRNA synthetase beta chain